MKIKLLKALTHEQIALLRRRGAKEFHPDLHHNDPDARANAEAIMKLLNELCDELEDNTPTNYDIVMNFLTHDGMGGADNHDILDQQQSGDCENRSSTSS